MGTLKKQYKVETRSVEWCICLSYFSFTFFHKLQISFKKKGTWRKILHTGKVLKPRSDRMVRPKKPRTIHFCDSFSLKNRFTGKPWLDLTVLRTVTKPLLIVLYFPLNLKLKNKNKNKKRRRNGHYRQCTGFPVRPGLFVWKYSLKTCQKFWIFHHREGYLVR